MNSAGMLLSIVLLPFLSSVSLAQSPGDSSCIPAFFTGTPPAIDGKLDDSCWTEAPAITSFIQSRPDEGAAVSETTAARICYDRQNLYVAFRCSDCRAGRIVSRLIPREDGEYGDIVMVVLDTYHDKRGAYKFTVNSRGIQADSYISDDGANSDISWNAVWRAETSVDANGWTAELAIPLKSLRFRGDSLQCWGLNLGRYIAHKGEVAYWQPVTKADNFLRVSKCGRLDGLKYLRPGQHLELLPYSLARVEQEPGHRQTNGNLGLDAKWNPFTNLSCDLTLNPDFAQIEADPGSINLSKYETYLAERRPFFIERADLFSVSRLNNFSIGNAWRPFYSRRIGRKLPDGQEVPIRYGGKVTGKAWGTAFGGIVASTGAMDYDDGGTPAREPQATYSALRLRQDIFSNSTVGLLSVNRLSADDRSSVALMDSKICIDGLTLTGAAARSFNRAPGGNGMLIESYANWQSQAFQLFAGFKDIGSEFEINQAGYLAESGRKTWAAGAGLTPDVSHLGLNSLWAGLFYGQGKYYGDDRWDGGYSLNIETTTKKSWNYWCGGNYDHGYVEGTWRQTSGWWVGVNTDGAKPFYTGFNYNQSDAYNYGLGYFGHTRTFDVWAGFTPWPNLTLSAECIPVWQYNESWSFDRVGITSNQRLQYSLTRELALRLFVQQNTADHCHSFNGLISWTFAPGSTAYLAYNETRDNSRGKMEPQNRTVVAKISYLWSL